MKYLGIDYGTRRIGVAVSDDLGKFAFPKCIIQQGAGAQQKIINLIQEESIGEIVLGESTQLDGTENVLMRDIRRLAMHLEEETGLQVHLQKEWLSSVAAQAHLYGKDVRTENPRWTGSGNSKKRNSADDAAAAVILQRYLDRHVG